MQVLWIAGQGATTLDRIGATREDCDPIPALLPMPDHAIAGFANRGFRKSLLRRFQLLQARNIRFGFCQPADECRYASTDTIDVVGRYFHWLSIRADSVHLACAEGRRYRTALDQRTRGPRE